VLIPTSDFTYRAPSGDSTDKLPATVQTIDTFGIASANTDGAIYIDAIVWANIDASGAATGDSADIDNFATGDIADWHVKGAPEAVARLTPGITALSRFVKEDPVSLKLDYSGGAQNRRILEENVLRSMTVSGKDYVVSVPASPFARIYPETLPLPQEMTSNIALTECPEQTSCSSFALYSVHGLTGVSVRPKTDLLGIGKSIPRSNVNINVVKVWDRQGESVLIDPDSSGPIPELLVKDDREPLAETGGQAPDMKTTGDPVTDIPAGTEKQFWIDVTVPRNTPAGHYTCQLVITSREGPPFTLTLDTNVLPLRLLSPAKQYVINYSGKLGETAASIQPNEHVSTDQLNAELADISAHGFHYISLSDSPDILPQVLTSEAAYSFQVPIIYPVTTGADGVATATAVDKLSTPSASYCYLAPDTSALPSDLAALKHAGLQTAAVIKSDDEYTAVQNNLDIAIYPVDEPYVQRLLKSDGRRESNTRDWLTWPSAQADPQADRLYSGFLLWRSDLYGAYISDYQTNYNSDPYDDTIARADVAHAPDRPAMLTYPTQDGVIDTVEWESIREGINDVRYLTTFFTALRECKDAKIDLDEVAKAETDVDNFLNSAFWLMTDVDYQKGRTMITNYAIQLRKAVDYYNAHGKNAPKQSSIEPHSKRRSV